MVHFLKSCRNLDLLLDVPFKKDLLLDAPFTKDLLLDAPLTKDLLLDAVQPLSRKLLAKESRESRSSGVKNDDCFI